MGLGKCIGVVLVIVAVVAASESARSPANVWIPKGFEAFESVIRAQHSTNAREELQPIGCSKVTEPDTPTELPSWATASKNDLRAAGFEEVLNEQSFQKLAAFVAGTEIVIKRCTFATMSGVMDRIRPKYAKSTEILDPTWDIYFDCGDAGKKYRIEVESTLVFGRNQNKVFGTFRLIALDRNVNLDGGGRNRIVQVLRGARLVTYGLTFLNGYAGYDGFTDQIPPGGWNGAAILVMPRGALIAHRCRFLRNKSVSVYARWGGGAAIKAETSSYVQVWGCEFVRNEATAGGAVSGTHAVMLQVIESTFTGNVAFGGLDNASERESSNMEKNAILVFGAAIRVDSVKTIEAHHEHVLICATNFIRNSISLLTRDLPDRFGYNEDDIHLIRATGSAVNMWNSPQNMADEGANQHLMSMEDCMFVGNKPNIEPVGEHIGRFALDVAGAGHCALKRSTFRDNTVEHGVVRVDTSMKYDGSTKEYQTILQDVHFRGNGRVYNLAFKVPLYDSFCTFENVDGLPDGDGNCDDYISQAIMDGGNVSVTVEQDDTATTTPTPSAMATPTPSSSPSPSPTEKAAPGFVACENIHANGSCEKRAANGQCSNHLTAHNCALACGMCTVCIDHNAEYCQQAAAQGKCSKGVYRSNCPNACGVCNSTPTPTPTPAPDFQLCENAPGRNGFCKSVAAKGRCYKPKVARECRQSCGMCSVCVDVNSEICDNVLKKGLCTTRSESSKCPATCGLCNPLPTPTPTPVPGFVSCNNAKGRNGYCKFAADNGQCTMPSVASECPLACGMCAVCVDMHPNICATVVENGKCADRDYASQCPSSCGLCNSSPTPTPTPTPTAVPGFVPCENAKERNGYCRHAADMGQCTMPSVASECPLTCGMCTVCVDIHASTCATVVANEQCDDPDYASRCPSSCGLCNSSPTPTPTPTPTAMPGFVPCENAEERNGFCRHAADMGQCTMPSVASECPLTCGMCAVCVDIHASICATVVANGQCADPDYASRCPSSCGLCNSSPTPTPTPTPTAMPGFVPCENAEERNGYCRHAAEMGQCTMPSVASECPLTCGMCAVCVDIHAGTCATVLANGQCADPDYASRCPSSCGLCNSSPTPTPTPTSTAMPGFVPCTNAEGRNGYCRHAADMGQCTMPSVASECPLTCGMCAECVDIHPSTCATVVANGQCRDRDYASQCPSSCGLCNPSPTPTPTPTPTAMPGFVPCTNAEGRNGYCKHASDKGQCSMLSVASECPLTCGMCAVCVDIHASTCATVVANGQCADRDYASQCPLSCGLCNPPPTPTPTPVPTPGPGFVACTNVGGNGNCDGLAAKGRCDREAVASVCELACNICAVCEDFNDDVCKTVAETGRCDDWRDAMYCPKSCGKCAA